VNIDFALLAKAAEEIHCLAQHLPAELAAEARMVGANISRLYSHLYEWHCSHPDRSAPTVVQDDGNRVRTVVTDERPLSDAVSCMRMSDDIKLRRAKNLVVGE